MTGVGAPSAEVWLCAAHSARGLALPPLDALRLTVADDEMYVVSTPSASDAVAPALIHAAAHSSRCRVFRVTGAWHARLLIGRVATKAFSSVIAHPIPAERPCLVQGRANGVASRAVVTDDAVLVLVASAVSHAFDASLRLATIPKAEAARALELLIRRCRQEVIS